MLKNVVLAGGARTAIRRFPGFAGNRSGPATRWHRHQGGAGAGKVAPDAGQRSDRRQRPSRRPGPERGPASGDRRRPPAGRRRHHGQQGVRLKPQGGDAGCASHPMRRRRGRRRRRHGKHVPSAVPPAEGAGRLSDGQRRDHRLDDPRRAVGRVQQSAHGDLWRPLRGKIPDFPPASRTILPWPAIPGRSSRSSPAPLPGRLCRWKSPGRRGRRVVALDEEPQRFNEEKLRSLGPAFGKEGTVTAGNASSISDGAAAIVVAAAEKAEKLGVTPQARILGYSTHSQEPEWFTTAPIGAIAKLMARLGWQTADVDLFEINEAFSVVPMAAMKELNIPHAKINVLGGAVALGHPIGASGARVLVTLLNALGIAQRPQGHRFAVHRRRRGRGAGRRTHLSPCPEMVPSPSGRGLG